MKGMNFEKGMNGDWLEREQEEGGKEGREKGRKKGKRESKKEERMEGKEREGKKK